MTATPTRRWRAAAALTAPGLLLLSGCVATVNFDAQTDQVYTPADGANDRSGTVDVLNALVVSEEAGSGRVIAGLSNNDSTESDTLTDVTGAGESEGLVVTLVEGDTEIPPGGFLQLADEGSAVVSVSGDPEELAPGTFVTLAFSFDRGETVELDVPVLPPGTDYADVDIPTPASGG